MREMKDSGVEWIGEMPKDWEISSFKRVFSFDKGLPITKENLVESGIPVLSYGQIHSKSNRGVRLTDDLLRFVSDEYLNTNPASLAQRGNILFADTSEDYEGIGNCAYISTDTPIFAGYHTIITRPKEIGNPQYLAFLFQTDNWRSQLRSSASGIKVFSISQAMLKETTVIIPSSQTQHCIADYLDAKCEQIDRAIARQQEVIEKLKEYKLSVITEAVTKGLNPDVPMKDSGIEWIGEIPEEWDLLKLRFAVENIGDIDHYMPASVDIGIPYVMTGDLHDLASAINFQECKMVSTEDYVELSSKIAIKKGDLLFARYATIGTICYVDVDREFLVSYSCVIIKPNTSVMLGKYLNFILKSNFFAEEVKQYTNSNTQGNVGIEALYRSKVVVPNLPLQHEIVKFLEEKCALIDISINSKIGLVNKLNEYKKALIYEVVTGKREV